MARIFVDYSNALAQAKKLERAAAELEDASNIMMRARNSVSGNWEGESSMAAMEKLSELIGENNKAKDNALAAASAIRRVVAKMKAEDKKLAAMARRTGSGGGF